ncbi:nitrile hydratase subunit beta [Myxosarcina sp. GI1]|uniref:nitrile hydratase subunit beta n=1 Tax=Myxosarcina sp. GI1 TaxID=1541065 RepID=UPI00055C5A70|nr:nitrile hydratase subunit beta [Myxosarcina sp. GI1]
MKLQHNLAGLEGLGEIDFQKRVFVVPWEERIFGIHVAMMGLSNHLEAVAIPDYSMSNVPTAFDSTWTWGHLRMGAEAMNPFDYFKYRYYEKWLGGISGFFIDEGYITEEELDAKTALYLEDGNLGNAPLPQKQAVAIDEQVIKYLREGDSPQRNVEVTPKFAVGDKIRVKDTPPTDHTRLPGNLRGKIGTIDVVYDAPYTYFFSTTDGLGEPMPVYNVKFEATALWGEMAEPNNVYYNDLFETYLEAA